MEIPHSPPLSVAERYKQGESDRFIFLERARECSALTIPAVQPPEGFGPGNRLPTPYQSLGARGVRTLASKLLLSLFPQDVSFFNWKIDDVSLQKLGAARGDMEKALASRERATLTELDTCVFRPAAFTALTHLIVTGNVVVYIPTNQDERAQCYRLDQFVTRRDASGNLLEIIIKEPVDLATLPLRTRAEVVKMDEFKEMMAKHKDGKGNKSHTKPLDLYTFICWNPDRQLWEVCQEVCGVQIEGTKGTFKQGELPYLALRFSTQPCEQYGRSYVEEVLGDLDSLEALSEVLVEGSAASARVLFLVDPAGTTSLKVVAESKNGAVKAGRAGDVTVMQVEKQADLNVAKSQAEEISTRLSYAFLLHSSIQRQGERVTAEEIRFMASELDDGLGGVYTLLAADFQLPSVRLFDKRMEKRLKVGPLPTKIVKPVIVTGLEAIGRGHDQANLKAFLTDVISVLTPQVALQYLKPGELLSRAAASYSIDTDGLIKSDEEIQQDQQRQQLQALVQQLGPEGLKQLGGYGQQVLQSQLQNAAPAGPAPAAPPQQ